MRRALGSCGSDGVLYAVGILRRSEADEIVAGGSPGRIGDVVPRAADRLDGRWPAGRWSPTAGRVAPRRRRCRDANFFKRRRAARLGTDLRLRFIVVSPFESGPIRLRSKQDLRRQPKFDGNGARRRTVIAAVDNRRAEAKIQIGPRNCAGAERFAAGRRVEGLDRNPGKSERNASTRNLRTKVAQWGAPRESGAVCRGRSRRRRDASSPAGRLATGRRARDLCRRRAIMRRDLSAGVRGARRNSHRFRFQLAAERRRGASLERFTNAIPLRPAPCGSIAMRPRCGRPQFRRAQPPDGGPADRRAIRRALIAKRPRRSTAELKKCEPEPSLQSACGFVQTPRRGLFRRQKRAVQCPDMRPLELPFVGGLIAVAALVLTTVANGIDLLIRLLFRDK